MSLKEFINDCLKFADKRLTDFKKLDSEKEFLFFRFKKDLAGADRKVREQLFREFIFHLVTAIDFLAQYINTKRSLNIDVKDVNRKSLRDELERLNHQDPIIPVFDILYPRTRNTTPPTDPYSEEGNHYRIFIYRNLVTHRAFNPITVKIPARSVHLILYPNLPVSNPSDKSIIEEMEIFLELIKEKCKKIINML